jgi:methionyl-tRNA formyltransferase
VQAITSGNYPSLPQPAGVHINHAPKIFKETCEIKWDQSGTQVRNFVRGLSPYPSAWCQLAGKTFKIFSVSIAIPNAENKTAGEYITDNKNYLYVKTSDGWISIDELQPEGKRRMNIQEFLRGSKI